MRLGPDYERKRKFDRLDKSQRGMKVYVMTHISTIGILKTRTKLGQFKIICLDYSTGVRVKSQFTFIPILI
jgi:hypothetical protein